MKMSRKRIEAIRFVLNQEFCLHDDTLSDKEAIELWEMVYKQILESMPDVFEFYFGWRPTP